MNSLIFLIFGSSAAAIANSPWVMGLGVILTIIGVVFLIQGYRKNKGKGGLQKNLTITFLTISSFMLGYLIAAYQTHDYFEERTHHSDEEECVTCGIMDSSKEEMSLMLDVDPKIMNPLNNMNELSTTIKEAIEINKSSADMKEQMRAEMMKHATVSSEEEVACSCPYHEQLEKEKQTVHVEEREKLVLKKQNIIYVKKIVQKEKKINTD